MALFNCDIRLYVAAKSVNIEYFCLFSIFFRNNKIKSDCISTDYYGINDSFVNGGGGGGS